MRGSVNVIWLFALTLIGFVLCKKPLLRYGPQWESLDARPIPKWYSDAKVGIFLHWGVYSVPSMGSEWFWTNWKSLHNPKYIEFMERNYKPNFSYQEFAKDFTAELFNATQWALLFKDSGAKYVVLTSKHHDGYTLWPSKHSFGWNSMDVGPKRDIIKELSTAVRNQTDLKFGLYYSLFEWFNPLWTSDKLHLFQQQLFVTNKVQPEQMYLVNEYLPEVIWSDGEWEAPDVYWKSREFLSWLYNDSPVRETVVVNDRWGFATACKHGGFYTCADRYNPGTLQKHKFENAFTLDRTSWGQRYDVTLADFMTTKEVIKEIVTTVSCNGNVLVNVGPTKYGTIAPIFEERLREMGRWLKINGEGIYGSDTWHFVNDSVVPNVWYTTSKKSAPNITLFAFVLEYPYETNQIDLHPLGPDGKVERDNVIVTGLDMQNNANGSEKKLTIADITLLGMEDERLAWNIRNNMVTIVFPPKNRIDQRGLDWAWTFKITFP